MENISSQSVNLQKFQYIVDLQLDLGSDNSFNLTTLVTASMRSNNGYSLSSSTLNLFSIQCSTASVNNTAVSNFGNNYPFLFVSFDSTKFRAKFFPLSNSGGINFAILTPLISCPLDSVAVPTSVQYINSTFCPEIAVSPISLSTVYTDFFNFRVGDYSTALCSNSNPMVVSLIITEYVILS